MHCSREIRRVARSFSRISLAFSSMLLFRKDIFAAGSLAKEKKWWIERRRRARGRRTVRFLSAAALTWIRWDGISNVIGLNNLALFPSTWASRRASSIFTSGPLPVDSLPDRRKIRVVCVLLLSTPYGRRIYGTASVEPAATFLQPDDATRYYQEMSGSEKYIYSRTRYTPR